MNIQEFKAQLGAGGTRPNQFLVTINWPALVQNAPEGTKNLLVTSANLPASNVNPTLVSYRGREVKFAGERVFDPWSVTVLNDTSMSMRRAFENWSNLMNNRVNNGGSILPVSYFADIEVAQLDRNDGVIRTYILKDAFPMNVGEVALSYSANDVISEFNVTFQYQYFDVNPSPNLQVWPGFNVS
jgi:hypothetical protein